MNNRRKSPLEDEFINSTVYRVADKLADGINKAASEVSRAINDTLPKNGRYNYVAPPPPNPPPPPANGHQRPPGYGAPPPQAQRGYTGQSRKSSQKTPYTGQNGGPYSNGYYQYSRPRPVPPPQMPKTKIVRSKSYMKFYLAGIFCLLYSMGGPLNRWQDLIYLAMAGLAGFFIGKIFFRGKKKVVPIEEEPAPKKEPAPAPKPEPKAKKSTGNAELDKIIEDGDEYIIKLRASNEAIKDEGISASIDRMEAASLNIFEYVTDHPEQIPQIKKFMNYYLPTTLKLLNSYEKLSRQAVKGENISSTMFDIEGMMQTIATAFEKQLDSLFSTEAMDIQADITVFESILEQEGLKNDDEQVQTKL